MQRIVLVVVLALFNGIAAQVAAQLLPVPFLEPDPPTLAVAVSPQPPSYDRPSQDASTELSAVGSCSWTRLGGIDIALTWQFTTAQPAAQRVDVSKFRDGFANERFLTSGERPAAERGLVFDSPEPGINYYWRLLTRTPDGWAVRGAGRVQAPVCPVDWVKE